MACKHSLTLDDSDFVEKTEFTIAIMGDIGVGKSTTLCRLFKQWLQMTNLVLKKGENVGDDLCVKDRYLSAIMMDTSSSKWLSCLGLPNCDVYVLVYSLVSEKSFRSVCAVREEILQQRGAKAPIVFVGNKTDIADSYDKNERAVRDLTISSEWGHGHVEISAEHDASVRQLLEEIMRRFQKYESDVKSPSPALTRIQNIKKLFSRKKRDHLPSSISYGGHGCAVDK